MNVEQYAPLARRTLKELPFTEHMTHMAVGITGEMGELLDAIKKVMVYGKSLDQVNMLEEVGDALWYVVNLLPELVVEPVYMERALYRGVMKAEGRQLEGMGLVAALLSINKAVASVCADLPNLNEEEAPGTSFAVAVIENLAGNMGVVCQLLGIDPVQAMDRNIAKLAARYGDKYSDVAALNRNTNDERKVLEDGLVGCVQTFTFEQFLDYGRAEHASKDQPLVGGMPWSFQFFDMAATHETDDCYIMDGTKICPGDVLYVVNGKVSGITHPALDETSPLEPSDLN
jgi:NTP pyrophosphatase (non-canonical NTP hydrolase)